MKSYNKYIVGGLRVILGDTDIRLKLGFFIGITLGRLDNYIWEKNQKGDLKWDKAI